MHLYAAAASPLGQAAMNLASEGVKTKGPRAAFAVVLMFGILCGGVFLLLQSNFGPKVGYLVTGTAFWGCWLVLSLLWLVGVPGLPMPGPIPDVPTSTPRYTGPQGTASSWHLVDTDEERAKHRLPETLIPVDPANLTDQSTTGQVTAAQTAAVEGIAAYYADRLGVSPDEVALGQVYDLEQPEIARENRRVQYVRFRTKPATPNASASEETRALIGRVRPATFDMYFEPGNLPIPTYVSIAVFLVLFLVHLVLLGLTDTQRTPRPEGVPERLVNA